MAVELSMVPEDRRALAHDALDEAFPAGGVDAVETGPTGASGALTFRVHRRDGDHLLRLEGDRMPGRNPHQYRNLRAAADEGIAPAVRVVDEVAGVLVMEWVDARPLADFPGGPPRWWRRRRTSSAASSSCRRSRATTTGRR